MSVKPHSIASGRSLSQTVPIYFSILFIFFTSTLLYWTYQTSNIFITQSLQRNLSQIQLTAENTFEHILDHLELTINYIATDPLLSTAFIADNKELTREIMRNSLNSKMMSRLDVLFIEDLNHNIYADESSPFFNLKEILPLIAKETKIERAPSRLFSFPAQLSKLVIVGISFPLIEKSSGRIMGAIFGGIVLNDNISIVDTIRKKTQVENLILFNDERVIASTWKRNAPPFQQSLNNLPSQETGFLKLDNNRVAHLQNLQIYSLSSSLKLLFVIEDSSFNDIKTSYQRKLFSLVFIILCLSLLTLYLVRRMIIAPLAQLSSYATQIATGSEASYQVGAILEFNQIGVVITQTVAGLQQTRDQLQEEMARRQEAMDQLSVHRNSLEQIVEMRTKELSASNKMLTARNSELDREKAERIQTQSEIRQLAEAVKNSPVSIVITDNNGIIEYVNPKFSELTQYSAEEAIGQNPQILNAGLQSHEHYQKMWDTILSGQEWHGEFCNKKKDGELFWELASISPILDEDGTIRHFVTVKEDITSRKLTESNLLLAQQRAEEANRQKSLFLTNMSHEIRTPMNAIIGLTELALETSLTTQQNDFLNKIQTSSHDLLAVLNDILDFSKIEAGKLALENNLFSLDDIVEQMRILFIDQARQKGLLLQLILDDNVPTIHIGDSTRLRQVLINLIGNAIKFTREGAITLTISLVELSDDSSTIQFSVVDSGIGIPSGKLSKLFKAFSQVDSSHTREYGGTGLGLAISRQLVEMMGGKLEVESSKGMGSHFFFGVKLESGGHERITSKDQKLNQEKAKLSAIQQVNGARILLVDDHTTNQQITLAMLKRANITAKLATNGPDAVERYSMCISKGLPFDAILMDTQIPILDGYRATKKIRTLEAGYDTLKPVVIIGMSSHVRQQDRDKGLAAGMDDFLNKPMDSARLFTTLAQWINNRDGEHSMNPPQLQTEQQVQHIQPPPSLPDTMPGVNIQGGVARLEGHTAIYLELLKNFSDHYASSSDKARRLLQAADKKAAQRLFHTIKGTAANLCADRIQDLALKLEHATVKQKNIEELLGQFTLAFEELHASVTSLESQGHFHVNYASSSSQTEDRQANVRMIEKLITLLERMDFESVQSWQELKASLVNSTAVASIDEIEFCISNYDFIKAADLLKDLTKEIDLSS